MKAPKPSPSPSSLTAQIDGLAEHADRLLSFMREERFPLVDWRGVATHERGFALRVDDCNNACCFVWHGHPAGRDERPLSALSEALAQRGFSEKDL